MLSLLSRPARSRASGGLHLSEIGRRICYTFWMKIVSSGKVINSSEFYKKKQRRRRVQLILSVIGFLSVLTSFTFFVRQEKFLITGVVIEGEDVIQKEELIRTTESLLKGDILWTIPRASIFLYPRRSIERRLAVEFPRLKSVNLTLDDTMKIIIAVDERTPFALYCAGAAIPRDIALVPQTGGCFFLDEEGLIFASAPSFSGGVYFVYADDNSVTNPLGRRFLSTESFKSLSKFVRDIETLGIHSVALEVKNDEYILSTTGNSYGGWGRT